MKILHLALALAFAVVPASVEAQLASGSMNVQWNPGAEDCKKNPQPPLQVHRYNETTVILRQNLCSTFEAPFVFLIIGSERAMMIDTGDVADPAKMPLAATVMNLVPGPAGAKLPLLVVHTHRHMDHRAGDGQFEKLPGVEVVGFDLDSVKKFYHFTDWPNGVAEIDLGGRVVDVLPTPGHNETEVSFYDRSTGLFFSGDFLMPGRLLIDDTTAEMTSAKRAADFVRDRPVSYVLGNHIELNAVGETYSWGSQFHPREHTLEMSKADLLALPDAVAHFNGIYTHTGGFILMNQMRVLALQGAIALIVLVMAVWGIVVFVRRMLRSRRRTE